MTGTAAGTGGACARLGVIVAALTFLADQGHKLWMLEWLGIGPSDRIALTPFLDIVFVLNPGISYGLFGQSSFTGQVLLSVFAVVASIGLLLWLKRTTSKVLAVALGCIIGGALANALDRLILGGVADFFSLHAYGFYWYIFNIADVAIVAGVALLLYDILVYAHREDSPWHEKALDRVTALANSGAPWAIAWSSLHEFLAIVTHPKIYDPPTPLATALEALQAWQTSPGLRLLGEGPGYFETLAKQATAGKIKGPKIHDARIASICLHHGVKKLWSADRDFTSFPDLVCENPLIQ